MGKGTPIALRCPRKSCRALWPVRLGNEIKETKSQHSGHGSGGKSFIGHRGLVQCETCEHMWFSTHPRSGRVDRWEKKEMQDVVD